MNVNEDIRSTIENWIKTTQPKEYYNYSEGATEYFISEGMKWNNSCRKKLTVFLQKKTLSNFIGRKFPNDRKTNYYLALEFISKNKINWDIPSGKKKVYDYLKALYDDSETTSYGDPPTTTDQVFNPFWKLTTDESEDLFAYLDQKLAHDEDQEFTAPSESFLPVETVEVIKMLESEAYRSVLLQNFTRIGHVKQIRKAKILSWLNRNNLI